MQVAAPCDIYSQGSRLPRTGIRFPNLDDRPVRETCAALEAPPQSRFERVVPEGAPQGAYTDFSAPGQGAATALRSRGTTAFAVPGECNAHDQRKHN